MIRWRSPAPFNNGSAVRGVGRGRVRRCAGNIAGSWKTRRRIIFSSALLCKLYAVTGMAGKRPPRRLRLSTWLSDAAPHVQDVVVHVATVAMSRAWSGASTAYYHQSRPHLVLPLLSFLRLAVAQGFLDDGIFRADQHAVGHLLLRAHLLVGDGAARSSVWRLRPRAGFFEMGGAPRQERRLLGMATGLGVS